MIINRFDLYYILYISILLIASNPNWNLIQLLFQTSSEIKKIEQLI